MAVLMTAFTPLQAVGLLNLADDLLNRREEEQIDLLINVKRPGMSQVVDAVRQSGKFRYVWALPFATPGKLSSVWQLRYRSVEAMGRYAMATVLRALGCASSEAYRLHLKAFCPKLLDQTYSDIYQPIWQEDDALFRYLGRKGRTRRHLIDEGFATWKLFESSGPMACEEVHLYEPDVVSPMHREVEYRRMPKITPDRIRLISWLQAAFPSEGAQAHEADQIFLDQNYGSGMFRSSRPGHKTRRYWETRKSILKAIRQKGVELKESLEIRAHPYSSEREIRDLESYLGHPYCRSNGKPFEVEILLGRRRMPRRIHTIASTAAFLIPLLKGREGGEETEIHLYYPYFVENNPELGEDLVSFEAVLGRLKKHAAVKIRLHRDLSL